MSGLKAATLKALGSHCVKIEEQLLGQTLALKMHRHANQTNLRLSAVVQTTMWNTSSIYSVNS